MRQHTSNAPTHTHANTHTHTRTILSGTKIRYDNIKHQTLLGKQHVQMTNWSLHYDWHYASYKSFIVVLWGRVPQSPPRGYAIAQVSLG